MYTIRPFGRETSPYFEVIATLLETLFPASQSGKQSLLETLTGTVVGGKQLRYGPTPDPEALVSIRAVIREAVAYGEPIPILIPFGGSKQGDFGIDLAELMALRQIETVRRCVEAHYAPGLNVRIRLENVTDNLLFEGNAAWARRTQDYCEDFIKLASIVSPKTEVWTETLLLRQAGLNEEEMRGKVMDNRPVLLQAIQSVNASGNITERRRMLNNIGWRGDLPEAQIDYYRRSYARFYPDKTPEQWDELIALYFAISLARAQLVITGAQSGVRPLLAGFGLPIPGAPQDRRLYWRTVPERYTNQHRAPWIGKGYIRIRGRDATPAIAGWDGDGLDYHEQVLSVTGAQDTVELRADYVVYE